ncbi:MAG TPA: histidine kinase [Solirubrobacterales bacterium]
MRHLVAVALFAAVATATVAIVDNRPDVALAGDSAAALAGELAAGALLVAAALAAQAWRPRARFTGPLAAAGIGWLLFEWNSPGAGSAFTAGLVLYAVWPPLLAQAALRGPDERPLGRGAVALLIAAYATSVGVLGLAAAAVFDPLAQGCLDCPANQLLVASDAESWHELGQLGLLLSVVWTAAFAALACGRLARFSPAGRRVVAPVLVPSAAALALFGAAAFHARERGFLSNDPTDRALWVGEMAALALVAAGVVWERARARRARSALARLVVELGASPTPGGLEGQLADALGDPSLRLLHSLGGEPGWIDSEGHAAALPSDADRVATSVVAGGRELSVLVHRRGLLDDPGFAPEIASAARLAIEHERLHASRRAQLERLRLSRARLVATADAQRRQLERDLHDGAQQRLLTLSITVRLARRKLGGGDPALERELGAAEDELGVALAELRELAHGLFPVVLSNEGLGAALEVLAERTPRLVTGALPEGRFAAPVESAAYFVVAEALRRGPNGEVAIDARREGDRLLVEVRTETQLTGEATAIEDRVGALGGALAADGHHLRAELPCGS